MASASRLCLLHQLRPAASSGTSRAVSHASTRLAATARAIHTHPAQPAKVAPVCGTGPPPEPPHPADEFAAAERAARLARRRKHAELLKQAGDIKALLRQQQQQDAASGAKTKTGTSGMTKRFWKDVTVHEVDGALEVHLDGRPLRHPTTKAIIRLPPTKPHLAHAIALEWDALTSSQQATKPHLIPLTSLTCRALDLTTSHQTRPVLTQTLLRYLDTDSLLCFTPPPEPGHHSDTLDGPSLHTLQATAYHSTTTYLTTHLWPGLSLHPVLTPTSIHPRPQPPGTRDIIQGWIHSLSAFELAGLERATLAGKSLLAAARLVAEWSEDGAGAVAHSKPVQQQQQQGGETTTTAAAAAKGERFGVEEAAQAVSLEVTWQTGRWGEVEDTHDVEKEDLRRQLGSVVLLVSGTG